MISGERMRCRKVRRILQYRVSNKILHPEKFAHHVLLLFYPFRDEKDLLSDLPPLYQNKLQKQGVQDIVNINKIKFEPYGDLVDEVYSRFSETLINNQDPHSQIENDEVPGAEYPNGNDSEYAETNETSTIPSFMLQVLPDNEIAEGINSVNSKQKEVFNVVHKWVKEYVKSNRHNVEPIYIFLLGSGGTGRSHLVKVIYQKLNEAKIENSIQCLGASKLGANSIQIVFSLSCIMYCNK